MASNSPALRSSQSPSVKPLGLGRSAVAEAGIDATLFALRSRLGADECARAVVGALTDVVGTGPVRNALTVSGVGGGQAGGRFMGVGGGADSDCIEELNFYDPSEPCDVQDDQLPEQVGRWNGYCGPLWESGVQEDIAGSARAVAVRSDGLGHGSAVAVALYTICVTERVVWVRAVETGWEVLSEPTLLALEAGFTESAGGARLTLSKDALAGLALPPIDADCALQLQSGHSEDSIWGAVWPSEEPVRVVRFVNRLRGDPTRSPLFETAVWLAAAGTDGCCFSSTQSRLPPSGVLEYLLSLAVYDDRTIAPSSDWPWRHGASLGLSGEGIAELCLKERNQKLYSEQLHSTWRVEVQKATPLVRCLAEAKIDHDPRPPPLTLLRAVELQWLRKMRKGTPDLHAAFSGRPKLVSWESGGPPGVVRLQRIDREAETHPYSVLNHAMRSAQQRRNFIELEVEASGPHDGKYTAECPRDWNPGDRLPRLRRRRRRGGGTAEWTMDEWHVDGEAVDGQVVLDLGTLMLQQVTPLMRSLDSALDELRTSVSPSSVRSGAPSRLYRGLMGVQLDQRAYSPGRVVMWSQFSSSSADMGIATGFARGGRSAVFSIVQEDVAAAVRLSRQSRFAREREWLFPADTLFLVESSLSDEFAEMLGRKALQLFELRVVSRRQALALRVRRVMSDVHGENAAARVGGLFRVARLLDDERVPARQAAEALLAHSNGVVGAGEARSLLQPLCAIALEQPQRMAEEALFAAAADHGCDAIEPLVQIGANPNASEGGPKRGTTPLHVAAAAGCVLTVQKLLDAGADATARDAAGLLPVEVAAHARMHDNVRALARVSALPHSLATTYTSLPVIPTAIAVVLVSAAFACTVAALLLPALSYSAGASDPPPDPGTFIGTGTCVGEWGSVMELVTVSVPTIRDCFALLSNSTVAGVEIAPMTRSVTCYVWTQAGFGGRIASGVSNSPLPAGPVGLLQHTIGSNRSVSSSCWRSAAAATHAVYSYTHLSTWAECGGDGEACGYAPADPGWVCESHGLTETAGVRKCADGKMCASDECCAGHGGVLECPYDFPVQCAAECGSGAKGCCVREQTMCTETRRRVCPNSPFLPCTDHGWELTHGNVCQDVRDEGACGMEAGAYFWSSPFGETFGRHCPATCRACPGSAVAEHELAGATSLLTDGIVNEDGQGCVPLPDGVLLTFRQSLDVSSAQLHAFNASAITAEVAVSGGGWRPVSVRRANGAFVLSPTGGGTWSCITEMRVRTSARVCELRIDGPACDTLFSIANACLPPRHTTVWDSRLCDRAAGRIGRQTHWVRPEEVSGALGASRCIAFIPSTATEVRPVSVCVNLPLTSDVTVPRLPTTGVCSRGGLVEEFYEIPVSGLEDCLELLQRWAAPELATGATILGWSCLLHVHPGVALPGLGVPGRIVAAMYTSFQGTPLTVLSANLTAAPAGSCFEAHGSTPDEKKEKCRAACSAEPECLGMNWQRDQGRCCFLSSISAVVKSAVEIGHIALRGKDDALWLAKAAPAAGATDCYRAVFGEQRRSATHRVSVDGRCPKGTRPLESVQECAESAPALRLPTPPRATHDDTAPSGCTLQGRLTWSTQERALPDQAVVITVCATLSPSQFDHTIWDMAGGGSATSDVRSTASAALALLTFGAALCVTWLTALLSAALADSLRAKHSLAVLPFVCAAVLITAAACFVAASLLHAGDLDSACEAELRRSCGVSYVSAFYLVVVAAAAAVAPAAVRPHRPCACCQNRVRPDRRVSMDPIALQ